MLSLPRCNAGRNTLRAELVGSSHCTAAGVTASGYMPILAICRALVRDGIDPTTPMECYRAATLALCVRSIGEGARLAVEDSKTGRPTFRRWRDRPARDGAAPPVEGTAPEATEIGGHG